MLQHLDRFVMNHTIENDPEQLGRPGNVVQKVDKSMVLIYQIYTLV